MHVAIMAMRPNMRRPSTAVPRRGRSAGQKGDKRGYQWTRQRRRGLREVALDIAEGPTW